MSPAGIAGLVAGVLATVVPAVVHAMGKDQTPVGKAITAVTLDLFALYKALFGDRGAAPPVAIVAFLVVFFSQVSCSGTQYNPQVADEVVKQVLRAACGSEDPPLSQLLACARQAATVAGALQKRADGMKALALLANGVADAGAGE